MQCRRCRAPMREVTRRGLVRYRECPNCGKRARKEESRDPIWLPPSESFVAAHNDQRHAAVAPTLTPFNAARGRRL